MSSLSAIASCSSMRQKVNRSVGRLQEVVIYVRVPSFYGGERRRPEIRLRLRANSVEKFGGFRIGSHLYKAVTYNFVIHIFKGSPYFQVSSGTEIC